MSGGQIIRNFDQENRVQAEFSDPSSAIAVGETVADMLRQIPVASPPKILASYKHPRLYGSIPKQAIPQEVHKILTVDLANRIYTKLALTGQVLTIGGAIADRGSSLDRPMGVMDYLIGSLDGVSRVVVDAAISEGLTGLLVNGASLHPILVIPAVAVASPMIREVAWEALEPKNLVKFYTQREQADREMALAISASFSSAMKGLMAAPVQAPRQDQGSKPVIAPTQTAVSETPFVPAISKSPVGQLQDNLPGHGVFDPSADLLRSDLELNPGSTHLTACPREPKPVLEFGKLLSSIPQMQERAYSRAAAGWEADRARNTNFLKGLEDLGVSLSFKIRTDQTPRLDPLERAYLNLGLAMGRFSDAAVMAEQSLEKNSKLPDLVALNLKAQHAISAINASPFIASDEARRAEAQKITEQYEEVARKAGSFMISPKAAAYERVVDLYNRGNYRDYLREVEVIKDQFGGTVRKELELRKVYAEGALAETPEAKREASTKLQEVKESQYPAIKNGKPEFGQKIGQLSESCRVLTREHFSSWFPQLFGPSQKLVEAVKDEMRTGAVQVSKTAVEMVLSGSGDKISQGQVAHEVQSSPAIRTLAEGTGFDLKDPVLAACFQQAENIHRANQENLEKLEAAAPELQRQLEIKADYEEATQCIKLHDLEKARGIYVSLQKKVSDPAQASLEKAIDEIDAALLQEEVTLKEASKKEGLEEQCQESEGHPIPVPESYQKRYLPFGAEAFRMLLGAGFISDKKADVGRAWTTLGEKYLLADPKKTWIENYMCPIQKNLSGVNAVSSGLSSFLGMAGLIATLDSAFGRVLPKDIRAELDLGMRIAGAAQEGLQFSSTSWDLLQGTWKGDFFGIDPVSSAYNLLAFPLTGLDWYRQSHRESAEFISESRRAYILDDALGVWRYTKGLVSLAVNHPDKAMEIAAAASAKAGAVVAVASNPFVLSGAAAGSGYLYWNNGLCPRKRVAEIDNAYLSLSRGNFQDATNRLIKFQSAHPVDPAGPVLSRHIHFMKVIGRVPRSDNFSKESKAKIMASALTIFSSSQDRLQSMLQEHGIGSVARIASKEFTKTTEGAKCQQP